MKQANKQAKINKKKMVNSSPTPNALAIWMDKNGSGEDYNILGVTSWGVSFPTYKETPFEQVCTCKKHHQKAEEDRSGEFGAWQLASKLSNSVDLGSVGKRFQSSRSVWQPLQAPRRWGLGCWSHWRKMCKLYF